MVSDTKAPSDGRANTSDAVRIILVLLLVVAQISASALAFAAGWEETPASRSNANPTLITPESYAFSIWGLIFLGSILFALYQALPKNWTNPNLRRAGWLAVLAFSANTAWQIYNPLYGFHWPSLAIILTIPVSMIVLIFMLSRRDDVSLWTRVFVFPLFLLGGWGTAASTVNAVITIDWEGWNFLALADLPLALSVLSLSVLVAALTTWRSGAIDYAAGVVWALAAIAVANTGDDGNQTVYIAAIGASVLLGLVLLASWVAAFNRRKTTA
ncbi:hypothetical protein [Hyphobacterium sp.]|uniref:hypothetical protein n=1 Tax=Hyphobacterium sp. TaxID=2004662 RepID=UPI003BAB3960